jgi:hypothetical protein
MDLVRRRLSSSSNNISNMCLDGAMGIPLQVVKCLKDPYVFGLQDPLVRGTNPDLDPNIIKQK